MTMIGYGRYQYTVKGSPEPVTWPVLGVALQKNYLSFYCSAYADGSPFTCAYAMPANWAGHESVPKAC
jgi:hypothetical protein